MKQWLRKLERSGPLWGAQAAFNTARRADEAVSASGGVPIRRPRLQLGFTLLEVVVSLAILGVSLGSLMSSNASSINVVGRARDITIATLLARSKLVDIEQHLYDEGFQLNTEKEKGDFKDEGWPDYKWEYAIYEVEFDLMNMMQGMDGGDGDGGMLGALGMGGGMGADDSQKDMMADGIGDMMAMLGGLLDPFLQKLGQSIRLVRLTITWPAGKYTRKVEFSRMAVKRDFLFTPSAPAGGTATGTQGTDTKGKSGTGTGGNPNRNLPPMIPNAGKF